MNSDYGRTVCAHPLCPPTVYCHRSACTCGAVLGGLKCLPQAYVHLTGCQIFATSNGATEPFLCTFLSLSLLFLACVCFLIVMVTERHATGCPFALIERASSLSLYIIIPPPLSPFPPFLLPPSQRGQPGGATRLVGYCCHGNWYAGGCRLITQQSLRDSLPPPPPSPSLSLPLFFCFTTSLFSPSPLLPSVILSVHLSLSLPTFSLLCFTHDQCRKSLGCCQPALRFCLQLSWSKWSWRVK